MDAEFRILKILFERKKLNYRSIVRSGIHPDVVKEQLKKLRMKNFVKEEGRENWRRGKALYYSLTEEGKKKFIERSLSSINLAFQEIQAISKSILQDPKKIDTEKRSINISFQQEVKSLKNKYKQKPNELTEIVKDAFSKNPKEDSSKTIEEIISKFDKNIRPIQESYKNIHSLICLLCLPTNVGKGNMFIGVHKGSLIFIPNKALIEKGLLEF